MVVHTRLPTYLCLEGALEESVTRSLGPLNNTQPQKRQAQYAEETARDTLVVTQEVFL